MNQLQSTYTFSILIGLCAAILSYALPIFPYTPDSACYIEQARSLLARGVFESGLFGIENPSVTYIPDPLFPPCYPVLIAVFSLLFQQPTEQVAFFLSVSAQGLIPLFTVFAFHNLLGRKQSLAIALLVATSPTIVSWGGIASADVLSLLLVIFCIGLALNAGDDLISWLVVGAFTGFAYLLRNANLSLVLTLCGFLAWQVVFEDNTRRKKILNACLWLTGFTTITLPWMIRNIIVFGKAQPYAMPPSTVGFIENSHAFIKALFSILLSSEDFGTIFSQSALSIIVLIAAVALLANQILKTWQHWQKIEQQAFLICGLYSLLGAAIVIVARTKYQWGELISERHTLPYLFSILVMLALILNNTDLKTSRQRLQLILLACLLLSRIASIPALYKNNFYHTNLVAAAEQIKSNRHSDPLCTQLDGRLGVSNYAFVYRIICAVPVRHVFPTLRGDNFNDEILTTLLELPNTRGIIVSMFPNHDIDQSSLPLNQALVNRLTASGWQIQKNDLTGFILTH